MITVISLMSIMLLCAISINLQRKIDVLSKDVKDLKSVRQHQK